MNKEQFEGRIVCRDPSFFLTPTEAQGIKMLMAKELVITHTHFNMP